MSTDGVQSIIKEIEKTSGAKASEVLSEAKATADEIINRARQEAKEKAAQVVSKAEHEAKRNSQRILAEARIKARREKIAAQEELVNRSFEQADKALKMIAEKASLGNISYKEVLIRLIKESVIASGADTLEIIVREKDRQMITPELIDRIAKEVHAETAIKPKLNLSDTSVVSAGGAVVRSHDGKIRVDNTFEARLDRFKEAIRTDVATALFGGDAKNE